MKRSIAILLFVLMLIIGCLASCTNDKQQTPPQPTKVKVFTRIETIETVATFHKIATREHDVFEFDRLSTSDSLGPRERIIGEREIRQASCVIDGTRYYILYYSDDIYRYQVGDLLYIKYGDIDNERNIISADKALLYFGVHEHNP